MTQLGTRLRTAREELGLSLAEAATATRILPRYIQALEAGDYASLPGDVYARGFIRNYAQLLHLPADELILLYRQERGEPTGKIKVVPAALPPRAGGCLLPTSISFFGTLFVITVLVALAYFSAQGLGLFSRRTLTALQPTATVARPTPTTFPTATEPAQPTSQVTGGAASGQPTPAPAGTAGAPVIFPSPTAVPPPTPANQLVVAVAVLPQSLQGSWVEASVDGVPTFAQIMRAGTSAQWTPKQNVFLNIGDTSSVVLLVNGKQCPGFPGPVRGVPRRVTIAGPTCP